MPQNRYDTYAPTNWGGVKTFELPLDIMGKTLGALQDRSDKNYAQMQELPDLLKTQVMQQDTPVVHGIQQKFQQQIDDIAKNSNGDYSNLNKQIYGLKSQIKKELTPGGTVHAASSNYAAYNANAKELQDMYKAGKIKEEDYITGLNYAKKRYSGIGQIDPTTGIYNQYQEMAIPNFDENKAFEAAVKNIKPDEMKRVGISRTADGRWIQKTSVGDEYITEDKAFEAMLPQILMDPDFQRYNKFRRQVGLGDYSRNITGMAAAKARGMAYNKHSEDINLTYDRAFQDDRMYGLAMEKERYRRARDAKKDAEDAANGIVPMATTNISNLKGLDNTQFSAVDHFQKGPNTSGKNLTNYDIESGIITGQYDKSKNWLDENSDAAKDNPLVMAAVKTTRDELRQKWGKDANGNYKVDNPKFMATQGDLWHKAIDANMQTLKNGGGFESRTYPLSEKGHKVALERLITNPEDVILYPVDNMGRVNDATGNGKALTKLLGTGEKAADLLKDGKMSVGSKTDAVSTGVAGTVVTLNGTRYISPNLIDPRFMPTEKALVNLGKAMSKYGVATPVDLAFLDLNNSTVESNPVGDKIMVTVKGKNLQGRSVKYTMPKQALEQLAQEHVMKNDPFIISNRNDKGRQLNPSSGDNMGMSNDEDIDN